MPENKNYYSEQIMQSIDTIVKNNLNTVKFDRTEICTIIQQDKDDTTKYLVTTNGGLTFYVYANENDKIIYTKGSCVYVTIPQGNYELKKIITGKYDSGNEKEEKQKYTKPFDNFVKRNIIQFDPIPNSDNYTAKVILQHSFDKTNFDYLGLEFSGSSSNITGGEYLIKIDFLDNNDKSLLNKTEQNLLTLSSRQIMGNPYNLLPSLKIQHLFPFEDFNKFLLKEDFEKISITLDTNLIEEDIDISIIPTLYFGYDKDSDKFKKGIEFNLLDSDNYTYSSDQNVKTLTFDLYIGGDQIYNQNLPIYGFSPGEELPQGYTAYWLQYIMGYDKQSSDISQSGVFWKAIPSEKWDLFTAQFQPSNEYTLDSNDSLNKPNAQFKIGIIGPNDSYIESNIIKFTNTAIAPSTSGNETAEDTLYFTLSPGDDGIYNNYGIDNKLLSTSTNNKYKITVDFSNNFDFTKCNPKEVIWKIPVNSSMLLPPKKINPATGKYYNKDNVGAGKYEYNPDWEIGTGEYLGYYLYRNKFNDNEEIDDAHTIEYSINNQFNYSRTNNRISCEIIYDNVKYTGSFRFQFGTQGTSGTGYSFNIYPNRDGGLLLNDNEDEITFTARLEDKDGNEINFNPDNVEWYKFNDKPTIDISTGNSYTVYNNEINDNYILVAELNNFISEDQERPITLKAYYPIARTADINYRITGASRIIYDFQGAEPVYDESIYKLYINDTEYNDHTVKWKIIYGEEQPIIYNYPSLKQEKKWNSNEESYEIIGYKLNPLSNFQNIINPCSVVAYYEDNSNDVNLYIQPILILQNTYAFPLLNGWDGSTYIDTGEGIIMSQLIGAGTKNSSNQYTGVLMGAVSKAGAAATTGIYGFQNGALRYKLDEYAAFYVGNNSQNNDCYISFNENISGRSGTGQLKIKVNDFILNTNNLTIDSEEPFIKINSTEIEDNLTTYPTRIKIGKLYNTIYGLDAYKGSLWLFPCSAADVGNAKTEAARRNLASLYFNGNNMYLRGDITTINSFANKTNTNIKSAKCTLASAFTDEPQGNQYIGLQINFGGSNKLNFYQRVEYVSTSPYYVFHDNRIESIAEAFTANFYITHKTRSNLTGSIIIQNYSGTSSQGCIDIGAHVHIGAGGHWGIEIWGKAGQLFGTWTSQESISVTSDINKKNSIVKLSSNYNNLFDNLQPIRYKYNDNTSNRYHTGFIAQDVEKAILNSGLTTQDFAGFVKDDDNNYYLRYEEFIALNTWQIQKLKARVSELEQEIKEIKNEIN